MDRLEACPTGRREGLGVDRLEACPTWGVPTAASKSGFAGSNVDLLSLNLIWAVSKAEVAAMLIRSSSVAEGGFDRLNLSSVGASTEGGAARALLVSAGRTVGTRSGPS